MTWLSRMIRGNKQCGCTLDEAEKKGFGAPISELRGDLAAAALARGGGGSGGGGGRLACINFFWMISKNNCEDMNRYLLQLGGMHTAC